MRQASYSGGGRRRGAAHGDGDGVAQGSYGDFGLDFADDPP